MMLSIRDNLKEFSLALKNNEPIICDNQGNWSRENSFFSFVRWLIWGDEPRLLAIGKAFSTCLDQLEKTTLVFNEKTLKDNQKCCRKYLKTAQKVSKLFRSTDSKTLNQQKKKLNQRVIAMKYRFEKIHGGLNKESSCHIDMKVFDSLKTQVIEWKKRQVLLTEKKLTPRDLDRLQEACTYTEFSKLLLKDSNLLSQFLNWIIKDNNDVAQFVEFPATSERIKNAHLAVRIGRHSSHLFAVENVSLGEAKNGYEKQVTLPFHTHKKAEKINILDETKEIKLNGGYRATIKKILDVFGDKNKEIGDLEFFRSLGISNWNSHALGPLDPITKDYKKVDLTQKEWWKELPVFERLSKQEVEKKYQTSLKEGEWIGCAKGSRQTREMAYDGRHGYIEVVIPMSHQEYCVFPFGIFVADRYPVTPWELICTLLDTVKAKISYPDENVYYTHREHANFPIVLNAQQGQILMEEIKKDLQKAREGHLIFQFSGYNCAAWVTDIMTRTLGDKLPNLFESHFLDSIPTQPVLNHAIRLIKATPTFMHVHLVRGLGWVLGSTRSTTVIEDGKEVVKSADNKPKGTELKIYQVGVLFQKIMDGTLNGFIRSGN